MSRSLQHSLLALAIWLAACNMAHAEEFLSVRFVRAYDGDTVTVNIPYLPALFGHEIAIRLSGIDAPEMRGTCDQEKTLAIRARDYVEGMLRQAQHIDLLQVERDKYFRIVAIVLADGVDVGQELAQAKLAIPYSGSTKTHDWCSMWTR